MLSKSFFAIEYGIFSPVDTPEREAPIKQTTLSNNVKPQRDVRHRDAHPKKTPGTPTRHLVSQFWK